MKRRETTEAFAEWFSIDPPFPSGIFGDYKLSRGAYCNGGIMPLTGGELARAALEYGYEQYGVDILMRYYDLISTNGETYLWYFPRRQALDSRDQHLTRSQAYRWMGFVGDALCIGRGARRDTGQGQAL